MLQVQQPKEPVALTQEQKDLMKLKNEKYREFVESHKARIGQWFKAHTDKNGKGNPPPIPAVWNSELKQWVWVSRKYRRG